MSTPVTSECLICGGSPHTDWRTDDLGANHRSTAADLWRVSSTGVHLTMDSGLVGADPGDAQVGAYLRRINDAQWQAREDAEARS